MRNVNLASLTAFLRLHLTSWLKPCLLLANSTVWELLPSSVAMSSMDKQAIKVSFATSMPTHWRKYLSTFICKSGFIVFVFKLPML